VLGGIQPFDVLFLGKAGMNFTKIISVNIIIIICSNSILGFEIVILDYE
jgi:hypothetical protein